MPPVVDHVVEEVEVAVHPDARVAAGVARPQVVVERAVVPADRAPERVVVGVQRLAGDAPLDRDVDRRQLQLLVAARRPVHVAVHRQVLVEAPARRAVVDDDVADRVAAERVVAVGHVRLAAAEPEVADDDVVGVDLGGPPGDADAVAGGGLAGDGDVGGADVDGPVQVDDAGVAQSRGHC